MDHPNTWFATRSNVRALTFSNRAASIVETLSAANDDSTLEVLKKLEGLKKDKPEWKAASFPCNGVSLAYSHGDSATVEATERTQLHIARRLAAYLS